jgi:omega-6 fatty acid desaturase (delta-12 desaturase)
MESLLSNSTVLAKGWRRRLRPFTKSDTRQAVFQLVTALIGYFVSWYLAYQALETSFWLALLAGLPAAGFTVRLFIISHDCGHGSFLSSRKWNDRIGFLTGVFAYTPYRQWRASHARHHATAQQIEERGVGYFWTMTAAEYRASSRGTRLGYRLYRHPAVLFTLGGFWNFLVDYRFPERGAPPETRREVMVQNLIYLVVFTAAGYWLGFFEVFAIQFPIALIAVTAGLWLFHVQHHYEEAYIAPKANWSYECAALEGSSYLQLSSFSQYFAGNINFHHVHHLAPQVPNYRLKEAHHSLDFLQSVPKLTMWQALQSYRYTLIDEKTDRWIGFGEASRPADHDDSPSPADPTTTECTPSA